MLAKLENMWWSFLLHTSDGTISLKESIVWFQHCTKLYTKFKVQSATPTQTHRTTLDTFTRSSLTFDASSHTVRQGRFQPTIEDLSPAIPCEPSSRGRYLLCSHREPNFHYIVSMHIPFIHKVSTGLWPVRVGGTWRQLCVCFFEIQFEI